MVSEKEKTGLRRELIKRREEIVDFRRVLEEDRRKLQEPEVEFEEAARQEDPSQPRLFLSRRDLRRGVAVRADADAPAMGSAAAGL